MLQRSWSRLNLGDTVQEEGEIRANNLGSSDKQRQWDYNAICANIPGWETFWQKFFRLRAQVEKRKSDREGERERTRKDADKRGNSRSFAYYRSSPIPTHTEQENIFQLLQQKTTHAHKDLAKKAKENKKNTRRRRRRRRRRRSLSLSFLLTFLSCRYE